MTPDPATKQHPLADYLLRVLWRQPAETVAERARRRCVVYLIPYLFFLYILAYLDRVNVSVAAFGLEKSPAEGGLGFDNKTIGFGAGIFFWGYWILEVPSTLSVLRWGARWVFVRILVLWGLACTFIGLVGLPVMSSMFGWLPHFNDQAGWVTSTDGVINLLLGWPFRLTFIDSIINQLHLFPWPTQFFDSNFELFWVGGFLRFLNGLPTNAEYQFYFFRFMLGFFEGGFFPSVILYLSLWFRPADRAKAIAVFMAAIPVSNIIGSPVSGVLLGLDWFDMPGWRWIFILQGIVPVFAGVVTLFFLPDRPSKANWLPPDEKAFLVNELEKEEQSKLRHHSFHDWIGQIGLVLILTLFYFCMNVVSYGLGMFLPKIIKSQLVTFLPAFLSPDGPVTYDEIATFVTALLYCMALMGMLINGWHSDHTRERIGHVAVPMVLMGCSLYIVYAVDGLGLVTVLATIFLVGSVMYAHLPAFWPLPSTFMGATAAASAIGFINMIGNFGGAVGPMIVGQAAEISFAAALFRLAPFPFIAASIIVGLGWWKRHQLAAKR